MTKTSSLDVDHLAGSQGILTVVRHTTRGLPGSWEWACQRLSQTHSLRWATPGSYVLGGGVGGSHAQTEDVLHQATFPKNPNSGPDCPQESSMEKSIGRETIMKYIRNSSKHLNPKQSFKQGCNKGHGEGWVWGRWPPPSSGTKEGHSLQRILKQQ